MNRDNIIIKNIRFFLNNVITSRLFDFKLKLF